MKSIYKIIMENKLLVATPTIGFKEQLFEYLF
jgi:hypothetical protein